MSREGGNDKNQWGIGKLKKLERKWTIKWKIEKLITNRQISKIGIRLLKKN